MAITLLPVPVWSSCIKVAPLAFFSCYFVLCGALFCSEVPGRENSPESWVHTSADEGFRGSACIPCRTSHGGCIFKLCAGRRRCGRDLLPLERNIRDGGPLLRCRLSRGLPRSWPGRGSDFGGLGAKVCQALLNPFLACPPLHLSLSRIYCSLNVATLTYTACTSAQTSVAVFLNRVGAAEASG